MNSCPTREWPYWTQDVNMGKRSDSRGTGFSWKPKSLVTAGVGTIKNVLRSHLKFLELRSTCLFTSNLPYMQLSARCAYLVHANVRCTWIPELYIPRDIIIKHVHTYDKIWTYRQSLAVVDFLHTQLSGHVIVCRLISHAPSHVHNLKKVKQLTKIRLTYAHQFTKYPSTAMGYMYLTNQILRSKYYKS